MSEHTIALLFDELYASVSDPQRLHRFTDVATHALGSHTGAFTVRDDAHAARTTLVMAGANASDVSKKRFESAGVADDNLWYLRARPALRAGTVLVSGELASTAEMKATRYYADFLRPLDTMHSLAICAQLRPDRAVMFSLCRSERTGDFDDRHVRLARLLAPHIAHAVSLREERKQLRTAAHARFAVFELDAGLRVLGLNEGAERLLGDGVLNGMRGRVVSVCNATSQGLWAAHCKARMENPCEPLPPVPIYGRAGRMVALMSLVQTGMYRLDEIVRYECRVRELHPQIEVDVSPLLMAMFALSPAEARLAKALHACRDLSEAAAQTGIALSSARTRLATIFAKTQTCKQGELIDLIDAVIDCQRPNF